MSIATLQIIATGRDVVRYQCVACGATVLWKKGLEPEHFDCPASKAAQRQAAQQLGHAIPSYLNDQED